MWIAAPERATSYTETKPLRLDVRNVTGTVRSRNETLIDVQGSHCASPFPIILVWLRSVRSESRPCLTPSSGLFGERTSSQRSSLVVTRRIKRSF